MSQFSSTIDLKREVEARYGPVHPSRLPTGRRFGPRVRESEGCLYRDVVFRKGIPIFGSFLARADAFLHG